MKKAISFFMAVLIVICSIPPFSYAIPNPSGEFRSVYILEKGESHFTVTDNVSGETITSSGFLSPDGRELQLSSSSGWISKVQVKGSTVYVDGVPCADGVQFDMTRGCVQISKKRFTIDTRVKSWVSALFSIAASTVGGPVGSSLAGLISLLQSQAPTTAHIEIISTYCDSPRKHMLYTTNYYNNANYSKKFYSYTSKTYL
ncbi:MAG: hypothetical protein E7001_04330 [Coriobacteriaceae bacterium]|nr:hypothetical protein [Coriobacteriaceae bacterium]